MADDDVQFTAILGSLYSARLNCQKYDAIWSGEQPIKFMAPAMVKEFGERITALVLNFARDVVDAYTPRLRVEGFRYAGDSSADQTLWDVWQANNLDELSKQAHAEALGLGRAYTIVGAGDAGGDPPVVTVESPLQVFARRDPRTRKVVEAVKRWPVIDPATAAVVEDHAMWYRPGRREERILDGSRGWVITGAPDEYDASFGVPVVPMVNRGRILRPDGIPEFYDAIGLLDAANKMATDMMVSAEFHAMPRRWGAGVKDEDFEDEHGNPLNPWSRDAGTLWATSNEKAKFGQFQESELTNFHATIKLLVQLILHMGKVPAHYSPFSGGEANPTSADALLVAESRFVAWNEGDKQIDFGGAWEETQRHVLRFLNEWDRKAWSLETIWRSAATPTLAQKADATLKLATPVQDGRAIVPLEQARIDLGYTPEQRKRMVEMERESADLTVDPYLRAAAAKDTTGAVPSAGR